MARYLSGGASEFLNLSLVFLPMRDCLVTSLSGNESLFPFIGLDKSEERLALNPSYFPCCDGKGLQLVAGGEARRCQLLARYNRLRALLILFLQQWGGKHRQALHNLIKNEDLTRLRKIDDSKTNAGRMLISLGRSSPSYLWIVAVSAVWRFGFNVHFVTLDTRKGIQLLPVESRCRQIVLVENLCSPWQPENRADCETIINYCHKTVTPLWIDFVKDSGRRVTTSVPATGHIIHGKLTELYDREPHLYLSKRGQSKLDEVMQ